MDGLDDGLNGSSVEGILLAIAPTGFYDVLRDAGPAMILAPELGIAAACVADRDLDVRSWSRMEGASNGMR